MVSTNFILTSLTISFISGLAFLIFKPELSQLANQIRDSKPQSIMEVPKV